MNYFERHLGDYARDAGHLSMLEHGAYNLLLDRYYTTEQGIPEDQAHRVCRARTRDEKEAVDTVLREFFSFVDGVWINGRAEREITKMQAKVKAAQENGRRGGRPRQTHKEPSGLSVGSDFETQQKAPQTPDTSNQSPKKTGRERATRLPSDFTPPMTGLLSANPNDPTSTRKRRLRNSATTGLPRLGRMAQSWIGWLPGATGCGRSAQRSAQGQR